jgi:hypothetical protein
MKILLIGILALASISAFANERGVNVKNCNISISHDSDKIYSKIQKELLARGFIFVNEDSGEEFKIYHRLETDHDVASTIYVTSSNNGEVLKLRSDLYNIPEMEQLPFKYMAPMDIFKPLAKKNIIKGFENSVLRCENNKLTLNP